MRVPRRAAIAAAVVPLALLALAPLATAQTPTPQPPQPPAIAQLCAATGIDEVDDLLDGVARSQLVGELSPLLTLSVPNRDTVELDAAVSLADVRKTLNCAPAATTTPTATATATPPPTTTPRLPAPTTTPPATGGFSQVDRVPTGSVETGGE